MKRIIPVFGVCMLLLTGCGAEAAPIGNIQSQYEKVASARMEAEVTLHLTEEDRTFVLACQYEAQGKSTVTIQEPEELRGVSAAVEGADLTVSYGEMLLPAGTLETVCPANVLPYLLRQLGAGYVSQWCEESVDGVECCRLTVDNEETLLTVWLESASLIPRFAEVAGKDGEKILSLKMLSFSCTLTEE